MDLFEILFIALFILFPVLEGILKQRKKGKGQRPGAEQGPESAGSEAREEEVRAASDMVPDDLWELMTGERRQPGSEPVGEAEPEAPWSTAGKAGTGAGAAGTASEPASEPDAWEPEPWMDQTASSPEPESLEYEGPEAYSLETPAPAPVERRVPSAEARHRAFHGFIDEPRPSRRRRRSSLGKALHRPEGLRQAVLLKEVLGKPKGLE
ncbi:MAG: hypothetical protein ACN0LA_01485 [Candidatus Longimicrobiales bacterium M2_2A_002]